LEKSEERKSDRTYIANKKSALRNVGEFLREARKSRNLSIEDLSSSLRIGTEQLIALESGDESALPEKVFIRAMVRRIAEKLNLDTSFILEELNEKKNNDASNTTVINKESPNNNQKANPLRMVIFSGILGLLTSIMVLKYIERSGNDSINPKTSEIFLLDKNIYF
jgi:cytoskeletal protein RodZ